MILVIENCHWKSNFGTSWGVCSIFAKNLTTFWSPQNRNSITWRTLLSHNMNFFFFPTAHSFGFVAFGIVICLCSTQMLYMVEHNVFYCLNLLNWSVASSKHANDTISLSIGALNFVFGVITSLVLLFTGMVIQVVEFSNEGYKIRKTFA